jgi:O-antigen ligase
VSVPEAIKHWMPDKQLVNRIGVAGLYAFALGGFASASLRSLGLTLLIMAFIAKPPVAWRKLAREPIMWLLVLFLIYLSARTWWAVHEVPDTRQEQLRFASAWASLWFFVVVARWLDVRRIPLVAGLALAGLIVGALQEQDWGELSQLLVGVRSGFGYRIPQAGLYSATAVIGLLAFAPRTWKPEDMTQLSAVRVALWSAAFVLMLEMLLITQSRISWLAVVLAVPPVVWFISRQMQRDRNGWSRRQVQSFTALIIGLVIALLLVNYGFLGKRLSQSAKSMEIVSMLPAGEVAPEDPFAIRAKLVHHGVQRWLERPLIGWGPGTRVAPDAELLTRSMGHLHNTYLELLARLGILGAAFILAALWLIGRAACTSYKEGRFAPDHMAFVIGGFLVLAIWCAANFRLGSEVRFLIILLSAIGYSAAWRRTPVDSAVTATQKKAE